MPSWNDGETSSDSLLSSDRDIPNTLYDSDFCGVATKLKQVRDCGGTLEKYVAFESSDTGRRFLGCATMGAGGCGTVEWVDREWPMPLKKALWELWNKYAEQRDGRIADAIESCFQKVSLAADKKELEKVVHNLTQQLNNAMTERDQLKKEKRKLEFAIADLLKAGEVNKEKLKKIGAILSDENV
ncbi:unnamed protein product [Alopecurus aequalis]